MGKLKKNGVSKKNFRLRRWRVGEDPHTPRRGGPLRPLSREISVPNGARKTPVSKITF